MKDLWLSNAYIIEGWWMNQPPGKCASTLRVFMLEEKNESGGEVS